MINIDPRFMAAAHPTTEPANRRYRCLTLLLLALTSASCGGGGGSSSPDPTPFTPTNDTPTASFTSSSVTGDAPLTVTVDAAASNDTDGDIVSIRWDFAGTPGIGLAAQHTFSDAGEFVITLTVTDNDGAVDSATRTVTVTEPVATASISGTVQILSATAVDSDVHDRLTTPVPNNTFDQAQPIPSSVTLGGYANVPNSGETSGNLFVSGDPADFYQVSLNGDELVFLNIAESDADLDLMLWDDGRNLVDASMGTTSSESIRVPAPGTYFVQVIPVSGASNYVLSIGQDTSNPNLQRAPTRLSDPFIPGEIIVKANTNNPDKQVSLAGQTQTMQVIGSMTLPQGSQANQQDTNHPASSQNPSNATTTRTSNEAAVYLMRMTAPLSAQVSSAQTGQLTPQQQQRYQTLMALKQMQANPSYEYAELNVLAKPLLTPNDTFFGSQWHYPILQLPLAWDITTGSADNIVAVVDTGVLLQHPDMINKLVDGFDFISDPERARDGDGIDPDPNDPGDLDFGGSSSFHGTHVAGTVGADTDNGAGVAGVAWDTRIMPIRVLGRDGGSTFDVVQGVLYAAGIANSSGQLPAQAADIINLSLGSSFSSQTEQDAYTSVRNQGVIIIASAGNDSSSLPSYPAAYDGVVSVAASTITNSIASYSNFGPTIDVAAPGGSNATDVNGDGIGDGVISTIGDDSAGGSVVFGFGALNGTSMAAPHVAGVAALMKAVHPALTPAEFDAALMAGNLTDDLGDPGRDDRFGFGLINAQKAVIAAQQLANGQGTDPGPILSGSASTLNFGTFLTQLNITLQNVGSGSVNVTNVTSSEPWLTIGAPASADGLGQYVLTVDRSGLPDDAYQATVLFESDANNLLLTVIMQVTSLDLSADAGLHYIILVDNDGQSILPAVLVNAQEGEYPFTINNVPFGQYRLFAGSDADDDGFLCDAGEACGAFATLDAPNFLAINGDRQSLEFVSGFRVTLVNSTASSSSSGQNDQTGFALQKPAKPAQDEP